MPYGEIEAKSLDHREELTGEPCYKKLKSAEEAYVFSHHGTADFHRIQEKARNDWVPVTIVDVNEHSYLQEDKTKIINSVKPVHDEMPGNNRSDVIKSIDVLQDASPTLVSKDDEIYSTSKAFIGPIYNPPEKKKYNERRNHSEAVSGIDGKGGREQKQNFNSKKSKLDNELFQFYKEIEELENEKDDLEGSCEEPELSEEKLTVYYQDHNNELLKSEEVKEGDISNVFQSHCSYRQHGENEPGKYPCNGQVIPAFCDDSLTSFRPEWQSVHSFIVPQGPPPPSFNYHLNPQRFSASPNPPSNIFHVPDGSQHQNGYYVNSCHINWDCLTFDQNNDYIDYSENTSRDHSFFNGYIVQDGYVSNGFCETRERCWEDPSMDKHDGIDRLKNQQFQEEKLNKLQKLLILLRGLPGSGKTTLSRERDLKKTGHRLSKTKQKRSRKRNKKQNSHSKIMEENSFETVSYHTLGDQDPSQSEEEDIEDTKRESVCTFTGALGNKRGQLVNSHKDEVWKSINPEDTFPNAVSAVELDNTLKNDLPRENNDLFLNVSLMPNENSVTCLTMTQNLSCVTSDDCSGTKVGKHPGNRHPTASDIQSGSADFPSSFMQKREKVDKRLQNETIPCHQYASRTSDKGLRTEQGVSATKSSFWPLFPNNLSDEELQPGSERQSCLGSWPEGPHKFICEQRPKKDRWQKLASPDSRGQLITLISTSEETSVPGSSPETLVEEKLLIENEDLSPSTENTDSIIATETSIFRSCLPNLDIPKSDLHSTKNKKRREKRLFNLAPNFNLLAQSYIDVKERGECGLLTESHGLKIILEEEKDRISEICNKEETTQKLMTFNHHPSQFYFDIIEDPPLNVGRRSYSHYLPFNRHSVYFYKNPIPSLVLQYTSSFRMVSFTSKRSFLTSKSQTRVDNQPCDIGFVSLGVLSSQHDPLYSFRVTSDLHFLNESFDEKLETWEEPKPLQFLQTEDSQDFTSPGVESLELQLSQGFAFQLVKLFGSPGVPMESLLPDDCVVSLDWKTLKMIYLQWKTSVEKRQKKIG
ncbi:NEDD4-binding protein 2-like 2 isoform X4 [Mustela putorius furo]|uniref:NEDD4-binding protein 2-like 2 isoform X4 n=1 Tax=Mustela putorius furo TaxID=9669 RepID=A0A8U0RJ63_MUSPF|nr:NEDD4-binding protein 2-like 2 isoform X4 [Mustela putorius furo]